MRKPNIEQEPFVATMNTAAAEKEIQYLNEEIEQLKKAKSACGNSWNERTDCPCAECVRRRLVISALESAAFTKRDILQMGVTA